jgi:hypothetical protein
MFRPLAATQKQALCRSRLILSLQCGGGWGNLSFKSRRLPTSFPDPLRAGFSHRIKEEFANGHEYYSQHGKVIDLPKEATSRPSGEFLSWHNENVYLD